MPGRFEFPRASGSGSAAIIGHESPDRNGVEPQAYAAEAAGVGYLPNL